MHYLITGGAGFIGGHLTEALLASGHRVTVIDNYSTGSPENLARVADHPGLTLIEADILDCAETLENCIAACDVVFHLAAAVGVELVVRDPVRTITTNVHGTENVLKLTAKYNPAGHRRLDQRGVRQVDNPLFSETDDLLIGSPFHSRWSYACSKLLDEFYVMAFHRSTGMPGTVVRFFNTVGPRQTGMYGMVIPALCRAGVARGAASGLRRRDAVPLLLPCGGCGAGAAAAGRPHRVLRADLQHRQPAADHDRGARTPCH